VRRSPETAAGLVRIPLGAVTLEGELHVPEQAIGVILFAHGSGSSRHSSRNKFVADQLQAAGLATLLIDLLTREEEAIDQHTGHLRFDIPLLAQRLGAATRWLAEEPSTSSFKIGYFGASTGGGAALLAAAAEPDRVGAVVSRGGRPDLAGPALSRVWAPTLLIVGARDLQVLELNRSAMGLIPAETRLEIVPGASHLFEEPGTLEMVARLAGDWFLRHLTKKA
jgi:putative phosphoribosyl transferase